LDLAAADDMIKEIYVVVGRAAAVDECLCCRQLLRGDQWKIWEIFISGSVD
jgi:hypothetical protein